MLHGWPRLPIYLAQATGYYPTRETVSAQAALLAVYLLGALWMFVARPAMQRRRAPSAPVTAASTTPEPSREPAGAGTS